MRSFRKKRVCALQIPLKILKKWSSERFKKKKKETVQASWPINISHFNYFLSILSFHSFFKLDSVFEQRNYFGLKPQLFLETERKANTLWAKGGEFGNLLQSWENFPAGLGRRMGWEPLWLSQDPSGSMRSGWAVRPRLPGDELLFSSARSLASWTLSSGQATFGLCLRRRAGIPRASGTLRTPWRSSPAATTKVATTKTATGRPVATTSRAPMARWVNTASPRATARAGQPPSLIKFRVHAARALASLTFREFNTSQVSVVPDF